MDDNVATFNGEKPSKKKTIWIILLVLALVASNTAWGLFYFKTQSELSAEITKLKVQKVALEKDLADAKSENQTSDDSKKYREIPELGVKYEVTNENKDVTYSYAIERGAAGDSGRNKRVNLSTIAIWEQADVDGLTSQSGDPDMIYSVGIHKQSKEDGNLSDDDIDSFNEDIEKKKEVIKIGSAYFWLGYSNPKELGKPATQKAIEVSIPEMKKLFFSLKAIE